MLGFLCSFDAVGAEPVLSARFPSMKGTIEWKAGVDVAPSTCTGRSNHVRDPVGPDSDR